MSYDAFTYVRRSDAGQVFSGPCVMGGFFAQNDGGIVSIYDGTDGSGRPVVVGFSIPQHAGWFDAPFAFAVGVYVEVTGDVPVTFAVK